MSALNRKLLRDLWAMKGQAFAISMVMAAGTATFVMALSTLDSLRHTRDSFYRDQRFAQVFAFLKRAPETLRRRIESIDGVTRVETRVVAPVNLEVEGYAEPVAGRIHSLPDYGEPQLNALFLRSGRMPELGRDDEIVAHESFANAHGFQPGARLRAIINGRRQELTIVGIGLSPEHVFTIRPGEIVPDFAGYGVLWMRRKPLATAYDMDGAFNDVSLTLERDAITAEVITRLDDLLERYGGLGAYERYNQLSHRYLFEEFRQLEQMATIYPTIFLGVAAFLLNVVVSRLVRTEREQIATLKAFGYSNFAIALHYSKFVLAIAAIGVAIGIYGGMRFGIGMSGMYMKFYRFPYLLFRLEPWIGTVAAVISSGAALAGTLWSVRRAARQQPAEAMRPEPPAEYGETLIERIGFRRWLSQPTRMIARNIERHAFKSFLTSLGIALACAILMIGFFFSDAVDHMMRVQFSFAQRDDLTVTFIEPTSRKVLFELLALPGVEHVEPFRSVPVRLRNGRRSYRTSIEGVIPDGDLYRQLDRRMRPINPPKEGLVLTGYLGKLLDVGIGDKLRVEVLEGDRPVLEAVVSRMTARYVGVSSAMDISALNRLMKEGSAISGAYLAADSRHEESIYAELKEVPRVAGVAVRRKTLQNFQDTMAEQVLTFGFFITLFAGTIACGVVYNSARIALSERSRELASMRVLGYTRGEISYILLGELGVLTLAAIPLGFGIGRLLCSYIITEMETDLFRIPFVIEPSTYSFAATVVLVASALSALAVRRRLDHLDLVEVLKTRE